MKSIYCVDVGYKEEMDEAVSERLSQALIEAQGTLTQRQFAEALGVSATAIRSWVERKTLPSFENIEKIAAWRQELPEELVCFLYGREMTGARPKPAIPLSQLCDRVRNATLPELAEISKAIADRLAKDWESKE
jgi:transcriptional regulator with XRE-family HTH domain